MRRPEFIARQSANPTGFVGRVVAAVMERETADVNQHAVSLLDIKRSDYVLDVGAGSGSSLGQLANRADLGLAVGVDRSPVMCARATRNNQVLIADGRVQVECASTDDLPFESGAFNAVMSVHTLYFWDPAKPHLCEIARILKPGGTIVLAFRTTDDPVSKSFPDSVYTFRSLDEIKMLLAACGFEVKGIDQNEASTDQTTFVIAQRCPQRLVAAN